MMKQQKPLTKEQYLKKFSRAVRWRLTPQESEETIADYRELIFQEERDESKLVEELGTPAQAAHLITDVKTYRRWLAVFAVLAFGLFLQTKWIWTAWYRFTFNGMRVWWYPVLVMIVGLPLSLYWFRWHGQKNGPLSRRLLITLAVVAVVGCGILCRLWQLSGVSVFDQYPGGSYGFGRQVYWLNTAMMCAGVLMAFAGVTGLVLAKCRDRRWLALYILCLTVGAILGFIIFVIHAMDMTFGAPELVRTYVFSHILPVGAVGFIGTGVALC